MEPILIIIIILTIFLLLYLLSIIGITFYFARVPRSIYPATPDFGIVEDHRLKVGRKELEFWWVQHEKTTDNTVILMHAWGRDRGRMVCRARKWYDMGFNTIIVSARDHGGSDRMFTGTNLMKARDDVNAVVNWYSKPVFLHGHSLGGGASILTGCINPLVRAVVAESPPRVMTSGLNEFFKPFSRALTRFMYPGTKLVFRLLFIKYKDEDINPIMAAARSKTPMLMLYALDDKVFNDVPRMVREWSALENVEVAEFERGAHSTMSKQPEYDDVLATYIKKWIE